MKRGYSMNNAELVWRLIEILLQKDSNQEIDKVKNNNKSNNQKQDEAQLADQKVQRLPHFLYFLFYIKKELNATTHLVLLTQ